MFEIICVYLKSAVFLNYYIQMHVVTIYFVPPDSENSEISNPLDLCSGFLGLTNTPILANQSTLEWIYVEYFSMYFICVYDIIQNTTVFHIFHIHLYKICPGYDKPSDNEASALETCDIWSTPSLLLLPGSLWPGAVAPDRVIPINQIEQTV